MSEKKQALPKRGRPAGGKKVGGRKLGTKNKVSGELRDTIKEFIDSKFQNIDVLYSSLAPHEQSKLILGLLKYCVPTLSSTEVKADVNNNITAIKITYDGGDK